MKGIKVSKMTNQKTEVGKKKTTNDRKLNIKHKWRNLQKQCEISGGFFLM